MPRRARRCGAHVRRTDGRRPRARPPVRRDPRARATGRCRARGRRASCTTSRTRSHPGDHTDHDRRGAVLVKGCSVHRVARLVGAHVARQALPRDDRADYRSVLNARSTETLAEQGGILGATELELLDRRSRSRRDPRAATRRRTGQGSGRDRARPRRVAPDPRVDRPVLIPPLRARLSRPADEAADVASSAPDAVARDRRLDARRHALHEP